jgi:3-oxoacyl-(acyl-carrier-protein) synthase
MTDLLIDGAGGTRAMIQAIDRAGLAVGEHTYTIPVNSAKSILGHALSAASAIEIVLCALACERGHVHAAPNGIASWSA